MLLLLPVSIIENSTFQTFVSDGGRDGSATVLTKRKPVFAFSRVYETRPDVPSFYAGCGIPHHRGVSLQDRRGPDERSLCDLRYLADADKRRASGHVSQTREYAKRVLLGYFWPGLYIYCIAWHKSSE